VPYIQHPEKSHLPRLLNSEVLKSLTTNHGDFTTEKFNEKCLDGFFLLEASNMEFPDESRAATISGRNLTSVVTEDLGYFVNLQYVDASENHLNLEAFGALPSLTELRLSCNQIDGIQRITGFPCLSVLDLSYNIISAAGVFLLQQLPALRELDLCGNELKVLPLHMSQFLRLEKILLENNKMEDNEVFTRLSEIPNLRYASVAYNFLSKINPSCCKRGCFRYVKCQYYRCSFGAAF
jgi:Leucine-rich repeat (LRR) protein